MKAGAPAVHRALTALAESYAAGERSPAALRAAAAAVVGGVPAMALDYLSLASMADGREVGGEARLCERAAAEEGGVLASIAVRLGTTRLIDNVVLRP